MTCPCVCDPEEGGDVSGPDGAEDQEGEALRQQRERVESAQGEALRRKRGVRGGLGIGGDSEQTGTRNGDSE